MTKTKKNSIRILSFMMAFCLCAGLFLRQVPENASANLPETSNITKINNSIYNDLSSLLDDGNFSLLPETVSDGQDLSVIVAMSTTDVVSAYQASGTDLSVADYIKSGSADAYFAAADRERTSLCRVLDASGIKYTLGDSYDNVLSGFEITVKASDFYTVEKVLAERKAKVIVGDVYEKLETKPVTNDSVNADSIDEETGIFKNTIKDAIQGMTIDGSGVVVAVLDTGLDYTHSAFDAKRFGSTNLVLDRSAVSAKISSGKLSAAGTTKNLSVADVYLSNKVPYAYDYADKDADVLPINSEHGTHVAGIIAGQDDVITGVAPNAQLAIMKVFSDETDGAKTSWLLAALEDCVTLGVDVINMSLGTSCGFSRQDDKENVAAIYENVKKAGISLIAAGSNSYNATMGSDKNGNNGLTIHPDSGTVGSPSTYDASLSVASVDGVRTSYLVHEGEIIYYTEASTSDANKKKNFVNEILDYVGKDSYSFEYVTIPGVGKENDYPEEDYTNKIVLVERGDTTFEEKVRVALKVKGAAGIIIYNNVSGNISMSVGDDVGAVCSLARDEGRVLASKERGTIEISKSNQAGPFMSDFSSWGPTSDLKIKPEITAHGGEIKSAIPGGGYEKLSGTSMAAPNQAGATALVRQYVKYSGKFGNYENGEIDNVDVTKIVNQLMMSSTDILYNKNGLAYAVRKQGAGLMSLSKTASTSSYILTFEKEDLEKGLSGMTDAELLALAMDKTKLELGDDKNRTGVYKMTFGINNFSNQSATYDVGSIALTEGVNKEFTSHGDATVTMNGYGLTGTAKVNSVSGGSNSGNKVTVAAGKIAIVTVTLTLSEEDIAYLEQEYKDPAEKVFKYGMYIEGFITLAGQNGVTDINVPFLSFYGDWEEAPIFDEEYYDTNKDELNDGLNDEDKLMADAYATRVIGGLYSDYIATLGSYYFKQNPSATKIYAEKSHIAISNQVAENSNSNYTISSIRSISAGLMRNAKKIVITATEASTGKEVFRDEILNQMKSFSSGSTIYASSIDVDEANNGFSALNYDLKNNTQYNFKVEAFIDYKAEYVDNDGNLERKNARCVFEFPVYIDFEAPIISDVEFRSEYDKTSKKNRLYADMYVYDNHYTMGIQVGEIVEAKPSSGYSFTMQTFGNYVTPVYSSFNSTSKVTFELTDYIDDIKNAKGIVNEGGQTSLVPRNTNSFIATCYDYAMNSATYEIRIPYDILDVYFSEGELWLSPNETKSLTDLINVYPYEKWGEVLDYEITYNVYDETTGKFREYQDVDGKGEGRKYVDIINGNIVAKASTEKTTDESKRAYILVKPKAVSGSSAAFPSLKVYVRSEDDDGYRKIGTPTIQNFRIVDYKTDFAFYTLDSDDRDIGFTGNVSEVGKDAYGNYVFKMYPFEKVTLNVDGDKYSDGIEFRFRSGDESIVKVDSKGQITAVSKGEAGVSAVVYINGKATNYSVYVNVTVKDPFKFQSIYLMSYKGAGEMENGSFNGVVNIPDDKGITTIYDYAFSGYRYVDKDLNAGDVITEEDPYYIKQYYIGNSAIKKIIVPEGVTTINKYAFAYLTELTEIVLPSTLTKIGVGAFEGCNKLSKISFPNGNNLQFINKDAFKMAEAGTRYNFAYDDEDGEIVTLAQSALDSFPFGKKLVAIGNYAFENCSVSNVVLPATCQSIGIGSFKNCKELSTIVFESTEPVKAGANAFEGCELLTELELNAKVISANVCSDMTSLTTVRLGASVEVINKLAFAGCTSLKNFEIDSANEIFKVDENNSSLIYSNLGESESSGRILVLVAPGYDGTIITLGDKYEEIAQGAFSATETNKGKIRQLVAPFVTRIGEYAFAESNISQYTFGTLTEIGEYAFAGSRITEFPLIEAGATIGDYAFYNTSIRTLTLSGKTGVKIGAYAFANCNKLETVTLADETVIGSHAFYSEIFASYENYKYGVRSDEYLASHFKNYYTKYANADNLYYFDYTKASSSSLTTVTLGSGTIIGDYAFSGNCKLTSVTLKANANGKADTSVGAYAFYDAPALTNINLENAYAIGDYAFSGSQPFSYEFLEYSNGRRYVYKIVESVKLGEEIVASRYAKGNLASAITAADLSNVVSLGEGAFRNCVNLATVTMSDAITEIGAYTFSETAIDSIDLGGMTSIGDYAFYGTKLTSADLTNAQSIGDYAFALTSLTEVTFGNNKENATEIGNGAFWYCTKLDSADLSNVATVGANAFEHTALTSADLTSATSIGSFAFGDTAISKVTLGENLTVLGDNPFYGCEIKTFGREEKVENFNSATYVNENYSLNDSVLVEDGVLYLKTGDNYELISYPQGKTDVSFTVKSGTTRIAARAFMGFSPVNVIMPYELKSIGDKAFYGCYNLSTVVFTSLTAPALEEQYDEFYHYGDNTPFVTVSNGVSSGLSISKYYMWNIGTHYNNYYYGANFVNYVGKVDSNLTMVYPANGSNYTEFIYGKYFNTMMQGPHAATARTLAVIAQIEALPSQITLSHKDLVAAARSAYNELGVISQQALVTNYEKLTSAEATIEYLSARNNNSSSEDSSADNDNGGVPVVLWIVIPCVLIVAAAGVVYFMVFKKKNLGKTENDATAEDKDEQTEESLEDNSNDEN